jgi:transcriptional antiterminator NusG
MENQGKWYTVQTLSGKENKVRERIEGHLDLEGFRPYVHEVFVPMEKLVEKRRGKTITINKKLYPSYIFLNADLYDEMGNIREDVWYFIKNTNGVINFLGGGTPVPVSREDIEYMKNQVEGKNAQAKPKAQYEIGDKVKIKDGAFESFEGTVTSLDPDRSKLQLSVVIFGRNTPVDVEYWQVEKLEDEN